MNFNKNKKNSVINYPPFQVIFNQMVTQSSGNILFQLFYVLMDLAHMCTYVCTHINITLNIFELFIKEKLFVMFLFLLIKVILNMYNQNSFE